MFLGITFSSLWQARDVPQGSKKAQYCSAHTIFQEQRTRSLSLFPKNLWTSTSKVMSLGFCHLSLWPCLLWVKDVLKEVGGCRTHPLVSSDSLPLSSIPNPVSHYHLVVQEIEQVPLRTVECCRQNLFFPAGDGALGISVWNAHCENSKMKCSLNLNI